MTASALRRGWLATLLSIAMLAALAAPAAARETSPPPTSPAEPDVRRRIDAVFAEWDRWDTPGAAVVVLRHGEVFYQRGYGSAQLEYAIPITPSTVFHVASVSKQFTSMTIELLARDGKLSWDDEARRCAARASRLRSADQLRTSPITPAASAISGSC